MPFKASPVPRPIAAAPNRKLGTQRARWKSGSYLLAGDRVHRLGELDIVVGDAAGVMGGQHDLHRLVDIAPFRMVVVLFGNQRRPRHEPERLAEVTKGEGL